ncbi:MAG: flagellar assembly protein FliX [Alphaproteobacteria bacterium]|nr:flagellar assembly protein FliX [Alphaproteobacteria bacterium]
MKIERTGPAGTVGAGVRRVERGRSGASFADTLKQVESGAATGGAGAVASVSAIVAAQEVDPDQSNNAAARRHGEELLDRLDELRLGLIEGRLSPDRIEALVKLVAERRQTVSDPRLKSILDDIDLRAQVELAKLGRAP